jgi:hypothetical protein
MRFRDFKIEFDTIDDLYRFLEERSLEFDYGWDVVQAVSQLRNSTDDQEIRTLLSWEMACFSFEFRGSEMFSLAYSYDSTSEQMRKFPTVEDFEKAGFDYVRDRAKITASPFLKARYNHLLWKSGIRNQGYALEAINAYIDLTTKLLELKEGKKDEKFLQISNHFECLIGLSSEVNFKEKEIIQKLTERLLFISAVPFFLRHAVLDAMLKNSKFFKAGDFVNTLSLFEAELSSEQPDYHFMVNYYLPTALKIAQKVNDDVRKWHNHIGDCYQQLADAEVKEDRFWIKLDYYARAIHAFTNAANQQKKDKAEQLYFELKPKVRLNNVRLHFNSDQIGELKEMYSDMEANAKSILEESPESVYAFIMSGKGIFPTAKRLKDQEKDNEYDFLDIVSRIDFDNNKNISGKKAGERKSFIDPFHMEIQGISSPFLEYIFIGGITSGKLNYENLITFLKKHTWIGKPFTRIDLGGDEFIIDWIKIVAPSIVEYFIQTLGSIESKSFKPDYTLCIDSLVLKLEGLLRNFCEQANLPTNVSSRVGIQEANINQILEIEGLKTYFNEDDFLLFKYLLINDAGLNLRNNVAHCFYSQSDYTKGKMHLLLAALLRIGKFNFKEKPRI